MSAAFPPMPTSPSCPSDQGKEAPSGAQLPALCFPLWTQQGAAREQVGRMSNGIGGSKECPVTLRLAGRHWTISPQPDTPKLPDFDTLPSPRSVPMKSQGCCGERTSFLRESCWGPSMRAWTSVPSRPGSLEGRGR